MRILMTGATGFISKHFVKNLKDGVELFALGRSLPDGGNGSVQLIECDLASPSALYDLRESGGLPDKIDVIAHMAVSYRHRDFPEGAIDLFGVNCMALQQLLQFGVDSKISKFVLGSTCSVYDGLPSENQIPESIVPNPTRYWPATKYAADLLALKYQSLFPVSVLRFATPYGPGQTDRLIPELIRRVSNNLPVSLPMKGDGIALRPVFISDAVKVLDQAIFGSWDGVLNVAGQEVETVRSVSEKIADILGKKAQFVRDENAGSYSIVPDTNKLNELWDDTEPFVSLSQGISKILDGK